MVDRVRVSVALWLTV